ncbi:flagellar basal body-associated FliL family protein [Iodidimonas muriae]|nr:flagellar basal body-associated FliL family protein [Iodidimonas muriae]
MSEIKTEQDVPKETRTGWALRAPFNKRLAFTALWVIGGLPIAALLGLMAASGPERTMALLHQGWDRIGQAFETRPTTRPPVYITLPDIVVNAGHGTHARHLKTRVVVKTSFENAEKVEQYQAEIMDMLIEFFRTSGGEVTQGSAGLYRLRAEMLRRINLVVGEPVVEQALIVEFLQQ